MPVLRRLCLFDRTTMVEVVRAGGIVALRAWRYSRVTANLVLDRQERIVPFL